MYDGNSQVWPQRKTYDEIQTRDKDSYAQFVVANVCDVSTTVEDTGPAPASNFAASAFAFSSGDFTILRTKTSGGRFNAVRTMTEVNADKEHRYAISIPIRGGLEVRQMGRTAQCAPGAIVMTCSTEPDTFAELDEESDILAVLLPRHFVEARLIKPEYFCARAASGDALQRLVLASVSALHENAHDIGEPLLDKAIQTVSELILAGVGNLADARSSLSSVRAGNLLRAKRIIRSRCRDPNLTVETVARECGISLRYLQNLFKEDGRSCREHIKHERLYLGRHLLRLSSSATTSVNEIGRTAGFSNTSNFSKEFSKAFSLSPREVLDKRKRPQS